MLDMQTATRHLLDPHERVRHAIGKVLHGPFVGLPPRRHVITNDHRAVQSRNLSSNMTTNDDDERVT